MLRRRTFIHAKHQGVDSVRFVIFRSPEALCQAGCSPVKGSFSTEVERCRYACNARQRSKRWIVRGLSVLCLAGLPSLDAWAQNADVKSLVQLVELALASEPGVLSSRSDLAAAEARYDQRAGALWPQVEANLNTAYNRRSYTSQPQPEDPRSVDPGTEDEQKAPLPGRAQVETEDGRYNSSGGELVLRMPLIRPAVVFDKRQAALEWERAAYEYEAAKQQLTLKVVAAWLERLSARDEVRLAQGQVDLIGGQNRLVTQGAAIGVYAMPDQDDVASRLAFAQAELIAAQGALKLKRLGLEHLVGIAVDVSKSEPRAIGMATDPSTELPAWQDTQLEALMSDAEVANPGLLAADKAREAIRQAVRRANAAHWPTLDFRASLGRNAQGLGTSAGQPGYSSTQGSMGLDLRIPIFSGGTDSARVREAAAQLASADYALEGVRRRVQADLTQAWYTLGVSQARMTAAALSVKASASLLLQAVRGVGTGLKSDLDVLKAKSQRLTALKDGHRALFDHARASIQIGILLNRVQAQELQRLEAYVMAGPVL
jgi:outer membrane protein